MPKDTPIRWENSELVKILTYINNNIDDWCINHLSVSQKAIDATNNKNRDAKSVYNKIHSMIKAYEEFDLYNRKVSNCLDDSRTYDLVGRIYDQVREKKKKGDKQEKRKRGENQEPKERKKKEIQETTNRDDDGDIEMANSYDPLTSNSRDVLDSQLPFSAELVEKLFNDKYRQFEELRTQLTKTVENANSMFLKVNAQIPFQLDSVNTACDEKIRQISQLRTELIEMIDKANDKYEQLKELK